MKENNSREIELQLGSLCGQNYSYQGTDWHIEQWIAGGKTTTAAVRLIHISLIFAILFGNFLTIAAVVIFKSLHNKTYSMVHWLSALLCRISLWDW